MIKKFVKPIRQRQRLTLNKTIQVERHAETFVLSIPTHSGKIRIGKSIMRKLAYWILNDDSSN